MSERVGYDQIYRRVLGIGLLVSLAVHGAILAWGSLNVSTIVNVDAQEKTRLALAYVDEEPIELLDVRVVEADVVAETAPAPESQTSTVEAALDLEPPKLASAMEGSMIAVSLVDALDTDIESAVEFDRLGAAVAAAAKGSNDEEYERLGGFRIPQGSGGRGPLIIGGGGGGCKGPSVGLPGTVRLPGTRIGGFSNYGIGSSFTAP